MMNACFHCGETMSAADIQKHPELRIEVSGEQQAVCCFGCKAVAEFILGSNQASYYDYREGTSQRIDPELVEQVKEWNYYNDKPEYWGVPVDTKDQTAPRYYQLYLDIQGMHCSACAWLIRSRLQHLPAISNVQIDVATGVAKLKWDSQSIHLGQLLETISLLGYRPSLLQEAIADDHSREQELKRLVVAGLGMMQVMMYAVALYAGEWNGMQAGYKQFLTWVSLLVTTPVLFYSGLPFIKNAILSLKQAQVHMDIPIALAMCLAYTLSCINFFRGSGSVYFDSVVMFVFFISAARYIQQRLQFKNLQTRQALARMLPNFVRNSNEDYVALNAVSVGQELMIAAGQVIPVDAELLSLHAEVDESLLSGESLTIQKQQRDKLLAGTVNQGQAIKIKALSTAKNSSLNVLGMRLAGNSLDTSEVQLDLARFASVFVLAIISIACITAYYWFTQGQLEKGLEAALAVLVISCPCALSLAIPASLAALTQGLHRCGIHVMQADSLLQFAKVEQMFFDKTGTLTELAFHTDDLQVIGSQQLSQQECQDIIVALEKNSIHPHAKIFHHLTSDIQVEDFNEIAGLGATGFVDGVHYAYARPEFYQSKPFINNNHLNLLLGKAHAGNFLAHKVDDAYELLAQVKIEQSLRPDAQDTIASLRAADIELQVISGDHPEAVQATAEQLGIEKYHARQSSQEKRDRITAAQEKTQGQGGVAVVGDGINDAEVLSVADVSISFTEASHLAQANADILVSGRSLRTLSLLQRSCQGLHNIVRINLSWAISYNLILVSVAAMGFITPWMAAIGMSVSSLFVVLNASRLSKLPEQKLNSESARTLSTQIQTDTPLQEVGI